MKRWSQKFCDAILADLPEEELLAFSQEIVGADLASISAASNRDQLASVVHGSQVVQTQLMSVWRDAHAELCLWMSSLPLRSSPDQLLACCERFSEAAVLLEMITDPHDDGWELASWTVRDLPPSSVRSELERLLTSWDTGAGEDVAPKSDCRIVVFGGHPRDESKFYDHQFAAANVTLTWNTFEKGRGTPDQRTIEQSMQTADAVIVVTKLVSHNVMQMVKRSANALDIPFCYIDKATASQLERVIREIVEPPDPNVGSL